MKGARTKETNLGRLTMMFAFVMAVFGSAVLATLNHLAVR
jgi:hypothetical protein